MKQQKVRADPPSGSSSGAPWALLGTPSSPPLTAAGYYHYYYYFKETEMEVRCFSSFVM